MAPVRQSADHEPAEGGGRAQAPALSVIITTPDCFDTIRDLVGALRAQTARDALELVIVAPASAPIATTELEDFHCYQIVKLSHMASVAQGKAAGVRRARAPVVVMTEDHSFPAPDWAQALIDAHRRGYAAVGPAICNANPDGAISWADFIIGYGPWFDPPTAGEMAELPGHNTSYKRDLLLDYGARLESVLGAESVLHRELRARGHRLYLETAATTAHLNFTDLARWIPYLFHSGRLFAAERVRDWTPLRQAVYSLGSPLIPLVRFKRLWPSVGRAQVPFVGRLCAALMFALSIDAAGQCVGYITGAGRAAQKLARLEYHRDRRKLAACAPVAQAKS